MPGTTRVFLAVSSPLTQKALERLLLVAPDIEIVGSARSARQTLALLPSSNAQLLCIDDAAPGLNAVELSREVMRAHPCPILVLSGAPDAEMRRAVLEAGALELLPRPNVFGAPDSALAQGFAAHLKMLSRVPVIGRRSSGQAPSPVQVEPLPTSSTIVTPEKATNRIVAIGASTGGPPALMTILSALPANYPHPIVCVQHVSRGFLEGLVSWLDEACRVRVMVAQDNQRVAAGTVLFPPEDRHLEIGAGANVRLSQSPTRDGHRPSATVLFESVAASYGSRATGILLTGMGADGASGLSAVREAGGNTIAQDEASCVVFGMPRVANERGAARHDCAPHENARRFIVIGVP